MRYAKKVVCGYVLFIGCALFCPADVFSQAMTLMIQPFDVTLPTEHHFLEQSSYDMLASRLAAENIDMYVISPLVKTTLPEKIVEPVYTLEGQLGEKDGKISVTLRLNNRNHSGEAQVFEFLDQPIKDFVPELTRLTANINTTFFGHTQNKLKDRETAGAIDKKSIYAHPEKLLNKADKEKAANSDSDFLGD